MSELGELLRQTIDARLGALHVAAPGRIQSYDAAAQTCSVLPQSHLRHGDVEIPLPVIDDVPVCWMRGGGCTVSLPLQVGDAVTVFFSDRSVDEWRGVGTVLAPTDPRAHALTDAFVVPFAVWPNAEPSPVVSATDIVIAFNGGASIAVSPTGAINVGGVGAQPVALSPLVQANLAALVPLLTALAIDLGAIGAATGAGAITAGAITALLSSGWPASPSMAALKVSAL